MNAITLRNIPREIQEAIQHRSRDEGLSFNKTVLRMLEEALGLRRGTSRALHHDLDHLAGTWSQEEADEFDAALAEQRRIDPLCDLYSRPDLRYRPTISGSQPARCSTGPT